MRRILTATIATLVLAGASQARADILTYTETAVGSGSLDGNAFSNATITISETANTSGIRNPVNGYYSLLGTTTVSVNGVTDTLTGYIGVYNQQGLSVGFQDVLNGNILDTATTATSSYTLSTAIGPISNTGGINSGDSFATQSGHFEIDSISSNAVFTASAPGSAVPEPCSMTLMALGLATVAGGAIRKRLRGAKS